MARTTCRIPLGHCSPELAQKKVEAYLTEQGFQRVRLKTGELGWRKGAGVFSAMKFFQDVYDSDCVRLSAWVQMGIGPIGAGERDLSGMIAVIPKRQMQAMLEELKGLFSGK